MELGPGDGALSGLTASRFARLYGLDIDPTRVERATRRGYIARVGDASQVGDLYQAEAFDAVVSRHVLEHVHGIKTCIEGQHKVLKPGGWALHEVPLPPYWEPAHVVSLYPHEWARLFSSCGFTVYEAKPVKFLGRTSVHIKARKGNHLTDGTGGKWWDSLDRRST